MKKYFPFLILFFCSINYMSAQTVTGTSFILKNNSGNTTAQLSTSGEGTPGLFFYDENNIPRITIGLYQGGIPTIVLNDNKGLASAILRMVSSENGPVLVLKEYGEDKLVIDKSFAQNASQNSQNPGDVKSTSDTKKRDNPYLFIFLSFLSGIMGGIVGARFIPRKENMSPLNTNTTTA